MILPRDVILAPSFRERVAALSPEERSAIDDLVWRILHEPTDGSIDEPQHIIGDGFVVFYEIDKNLIAQVTTFRRWPPPHPLMM